MEQKERGEGEDAHVPGTAPGVRDPRLRWLRWVVLAGAALLLLGGLSTLDLWEPDEPRIAMVAEELRSMRHGPEGLVLLHLAGEPYTQKPPLYYWLAALAAAPAGRVSEATARLPSALSGIALVALTMALGTRLLGPASGALGGALLLTVWTFAHLARRAQLDVLLALLEWTALAAFWRLERGLGRRAANLALLHGALGLAVLTKGPVGLLVPLLALALYLAWERRPGDLGRLLAPWALLLSLGPGLAWLAAAAALAPAGFLGEAVGTNLLGRFLAGTSHARPIYYYLYQFPADFLPWTLVWPLVGWAGWRGVLASGGDPERRRAWRLLLSWVGGALLFFSLSSGKRGLYLLPAYPAAALLCADALVERLAGRAAPRWLAAAAAGAGGALALGALALVASGAELGGARLGATAAAAVCAGVAAAALAWWALARRRASGLARLGPLVGGVLVVELCLFTLVLPALGPSKSPRPIAQAAAAVAGESEPVGLVGNAAKLGGIAFYSGRRVVALDDEESIREFLEAGGRTFVLKASKLERVEAVTAVEVRARLREGRRSWLVVSAPATPHSPGNGES